MLSEEKHCFYTGKTCFCDVNLCGEYYQHIWNLMRHFLDKMDI